VTKISFDFDWQIYQGLTTQIYIAFHTQHQQNIYLKLEHTD